MDKRERFLIALFISVACPATLFFLFWWMAAAIAIYGLLPIPDGWIAAAGFIGLGIGVMLDIFFLNKWTQRFYFFKTTHLILVYLFWSTIAVTLLMGLPFLNLALGAFAGFFIGRRHHHMVTTADDFTKTARNTGLFTALITGLEALFIGLLALREEIVREILGALTGLSRSAAESFSGIAVVIVLSILLMVIQFWCARRTAIFAYGLTR
jgi:hypothetical protein